jgi:RNA polymerase sigma factor (sigma-70 family)
VGRVARFEEDFVPVDELLLTEFEQTFLSDEIQKCQWEHVRHLVEQLPGMAGQVIWLHYGFEDGVALTQAEIARKLNITQGRVSQIEKEALSRLKRVLTMGIDHPLVVQLVLEGII